jgi:hypothetical protein
MKQNRRPQWEQHQLPDLTVVSTILANQTLEQVDSAEKCSKLHNTPQALTIAGRPTDNELLAGEDKLSKVVDTTYLPARIRLMNNARVQEVSRRQGLQDT